YSFGQCTPAQPPSLRRRCQSVRQRSASVSSAGSSPGGLAANQSRSSSRNASSSSVNVRSTGSVLLMMGEHRFGAGAEHVFELADVAPGAQALGGELLGPGAQHIQRVGTRLGQPGVGGAGLGEACVVAVGESPQRGGARVESG